MKKRDISFSFQLNAMKRLRKDAYLQNLLIEFKYQAHFLLRQYLKYNFLY